MANNVEYHNGARQHYGPYETEKQYGAVTRVAGVVKQIVQPIHWERLPDASEVDEIAPVIPANSFIVSARVYEEEAFDSTSGTTTIDVGLQEKDGTEIDNDGFDVDVITADGSAGGWTVGDGSLVGSGTGSEDGQVVAIAGTDDLTAGLAYVVIEYIETPEIA